MGLPLQGDVVAVGIGDGDARHRARRHVQREGCIGVRPRHVVLAGSLGPDGAGAYGVDRDGIGILDSPAIHVVAAGIVVFGLIERVVQILGSSNTPAHVFTVLDMVDRHGSVEGAVIDSCV